MLRRSIILAGLVAAQFLNAGEEPQITFTITGGAGLTGQQVTSRVLIATDTDMQGWSYGVRWDTAALSLVEGTRGAILETVNDGGPAEFIDFNLNPTNGPGVTQGVVVNYAQTALLPPGADYETAVLKLRLVGEPVDQPIEARVYFATDLGDPMVAVIGVIGGLGYPPVSVDGLVTINLPPEDCKVTDFTCETDPDNAYLKWSFLACDAPKPFEFMYLYRGAELLAQLDRTQTSYDDLDLDPGFYTYTIAWVYWPASGEPIRLDYVQCTAEVIALLINDLQPRAAFLTGQMRNELGELVPGEVVVTGRGFTTPEDTQLTIGGLPLEVLEIVGDSQMRARVPCSSTLGVFDLGLKNSRGEVGLSKVFTYGWMRGNVRIDGAIDIQDAIDLVNYVFVPAAPDPYCLEAADVNDDGEINVADPIFILYLVAGVDPVKYRPDEPFNAPLIQDPTPDSLTCRLAGFDCANPAP